MGEQVSAEKDVPWSVVDVAEPQPDATPHARVAEAAVTPDDPNLTLTSHTIVTATVARP